jgi:hypothetical protein
MDATASTALDGSRCGLVVQPEPHRIALSAGADPTSSQDSSHATTEAGKFWRANG